MRSKHIILHAFVNFGVHSRVRHLRIRSVLGLLLLLRLLLLLVWVLWLLLLIRIVLLLRWWGSRLQHRRLLLGLGLRLRLRLRLGLGLWIPVLLSDTHASLDSILGHHASKLAPTLGCGLLRVLSGCPRRCKSHIHASSSGLLCSLHAKLLPRLGCGILLRRILLGLVSGHILAGILASNSHTSLRCLLSRLHAELGPRLSWRLLNVLRGSQASSLTSHVNAASYSSLGSLAAQILPRARRLHLNWRVLGTSVLCSLIKSHIHASLDGLSCHLHSKLLGRRCSWISRCSLNSILDRRWSHICCNWCNSFSD